MQGNAGQRITLCLAHCQDLAQDVDTQDPGELTAPFASTGVDQSLKVLILRQVSQIF